MDSLSKWEFTKWKVASTQQSWKGSDCLQSVLRALDEGRFLCCTERLCYVILSRLSKKSQTSILLEFWDHLECGCGFWGEC